MNQSCEAVKNGMQVSTAAKEFDIPRSVLRRRIFNPKTKFKSSGGQTVFSQDQELHLKERCLHMCQKGFPLTISS